jgi:hypothetical protein
MHTILEFTDTSSFACLTVSHFSYLMISNFGIEIVDRCHLDPREQGNGAPTSETQSLQPPDILYHDVIREMLTGMHTRVVDGWD